MSRTISLFAVALLLVTALSAANASILVAIEDINTGAEWTCKYVHDVQPLYGGSIVELRAYKFDRKVPIYETFELTKPVRLFAAEYRALCSQLGVKSLAGHAVWWRIDDPPTKKRFVFTLEDGIRVGLSHPGRVKLDLPVYAKVNK